MRVNLGTALKYPFREAGWYVKAVFAMIMFVLVPFGIGYYLDSIKESSEGNDNQMPAMTDFGGLLIKGLLGMIISGVYLFIPATCFACAFGTGIAGLISGAMLGKAGPAVAGAGMFMVWAGLGAVASLVVSVILPLAMMRYATGAGFGGAFDFAGMLSDFGKGAVDYVVIVAFAWAIGTVIHFVTGMLPLLWLPLMVYLAMVMANLLGQYHRTFLQAGE